MSAMTELSNALGDAVASAASGVVAVLHGPCETTTGVVYDDHDLALGNGRDRGFNAVE